MRGPLDAAGIVTLTLGLLAVMIALTRLGTLLLPLLALGGVLFAAFIAIERRAAEPVIRPRLFAQRQLQVTYGLEVLIGILEGALFFIPAALVASQHLTYAAAGGIAALGAFMFVAVIPGAGPRARRDRQPLGPHRRHAAHRLRLLIFSLVSRALGRTPRP